MLKNIPYYNTIKAQNGNDLNTLLVTRAETSGGILDSSSFPASHPSYRQILSILLPVSTQRLWPFSLPTLLPPWARLPPGLDFTTSSFHPLSALNPAPRGTLWKPKMDPILPLLGTLPASQLTQSRSQRWTLIFKSPRDKPLPTSFTPSAAALSLLHSAPVTFE